ncbi:acyltransferase family protein [Brevibacterium yomogidense]|uniref:acyltransferase family protein n=1 Tax=Brevibacterium yomogidense TaxID=946573 RepID=UPI0018DEFDB3|nr:acyltransferase family protein [Brevibacterium yomogidense]
MDFVRGAAMLALLVWHASSIPTIYQPASMPDAFAHLNNFLAPYRMPVLMFLSGMLLGRSLTKPFGEYYGGKLRKLLWPYVVWAAIFLAATQQLELFARPQVWIPVTYLWFLLFVFIYYCVAPLVGRFPPGVIPLVAIIVSMMIEDRGFISKFVLFAAYFYLGHQLSSSTRACYATTRGVVRWTALIAAVVLSLFAPSGWSIVAIITSLIGIVAVVGWFQRFYRAPQKSRFVEYVGAHSIVYYLSHFPVMFGMGAVLEVFGLDDFYLLFVANVVAALLVGWVLSKLKARYPIALLFEFPATSYWARRRRARSGAMS